MDDSDKCDQQTYVDTTYFSTQFQDAYVESWGYTNPHKPPMNGCKAKYASYSDYGMKYRFADGDYINDCGVILNIYDSQDEIGLPIVSHQNILLFCHFSPAVGDILQSFL